MHQSIIPFEMIVAASRIGKFPDILQRWEVASVNTIPSFNMNMLETCGLAGLENSLMLYTKSILPFTMITRQRHGKNHSRLFLMLMLPKMAKSFRGEMVPGHSKALAFLLLKCLKYFRCLIALGSVVHQFIFTLESLTARTSCVLLQTSTLKWK